MYLECFCPTASIQHYCIFIIIIRVKGISGLRVADASVMRDIVSGNTHTPVVMIAEKAADMIRGRTTTGQ